MSTEAYIEMVYRNLKGELSPEEFTSLNLNTAKNTELAALRVEIEDAWDVSGEELKVVNAKETGELLKRITTSKKNTAILSFRNLITGVAALFVLALGSIWLIRDHSEIYTKEGLFTLADNSTIQLRKGSKLEVTTISKTERNVNLEGEAYFDIEKDKNRPFIITTKDTKIQVLGTSFLVKEYNGNTFVDVKEGKVRFTNNDGSASIDLEKGMSAKFSNEGGIHAVDYTNLSSWKDGMYQYKNQSLKDVLKELSIVFDTEIEVEVQQLLNCNISAILNAENIEEVLKQLATQLKMNAKKERQNWVLSGGRCE